MILHGRRVGELSLDNILRLIADRTPESVSLDYKQSFPLGNDEARRDFLIDVSAMANTAGGVLIYGITEDRDSAGNTTGLPAAVADATAPDLSTDRACSALLACIDTGLSPKLLGCEAQAIDLGGKVVFALGVPRSLESPHAVWFKKLGRFYRRRGTDNYQVEVPELRDMFLEREDWRTQAEDYHRNRVDEVKAGKVLAAFPANTFAAIHILPLGRLRDSVDVYGVARRTFALDRYVPHPSHFADSGNQIRGSLAGPMIVSLGNQSQSFVTLLRNGGIEYVTNQFFRVPANNGVGQGLYVGHIANTLPNLCDAYVENAQLDFGLTPPYSLHLTILGAQGLKAVIDTNEGGFNFPTALPEAICSDRIVIPAVIVETSGEARTAAMTIVQVVRQAAGDL